MRASRRSGRRQACTQCSEAADRARALTRRQLCFGVSQQELAKLFKLFSESVQPRRNQYLVLTSTVPDNLKVQYSLLCHCSSTREIRAPPNLTNIHCCQRLPYRCCQIRTLSHMLQYCRRAQISALHPSVTDQTSVSVRGYNLAALLCQPHPDSLRPLPALHSELHLLTDLRFHIARSSTIGESGKAGM